MSRPCVPAVTVWARVRVSCRWLVGSCGHENDERNHFDDVLTLLTVLVVGWPATAPAQVPVGPGPTSYTVRPQPLPGSCHYRVAANRATLPDPACTPGAVNPKVTQDTLSTTICRAGYTKSIRPPKRITEAEKRANAAAYGYTGSLSSVEFDHLVPLEVGGDPNDPRNVGGARRVAQPEGRGRVQAAPSGVRRRGAAGRRTGGDRRRLDHRAMGCPLAVVG